MKSLEHLPESFQSLLMDKIQTWQQSQSGQTSSYEYEKSFHDLMQDLGREILQSSVGEEGNARKKNKS